MNSGNINRITRKAYAKINLGLDVLRRMENGYHEVKMIMQTISLYDTLNFIRQDAGISVITDKEELPGDESNLIYKAAKLLMDTYNITDGIRIELNKNIPMAAGMAGGSTDAAAVFHGMNEMFELGMSEDTMCRLGVRIGADVPYCIQGGTALSEGIGEILTKLSDAPNCSILIAKPDVDVSTGYVYGNLRVNGLQKHPDIDGMRKAIEDGDLRGITCRMENVLETVTIRKYPVIEEIKGYMKENGALNALMSGSGPTVFGVFESEEKAQEVLEQLQKKELVKQLFNVRLVNRTEAGLG